MIQIRVNDEVIHLQQTCLIADWMQSAKYKAVFFDPPHFALMLNRQFIARDSYANTWLQAGDVLEFVTAMQGG